MQEQLQRGGCWAQGLPSNGAGQPWRAAPSGGKSGGSRSPVLGTRSGSSAPRRVDLGNGFSPSFLFPIYGGDNSTLCHGLGAARSWFPEIPGWAGALELGLGMAGLALRGQGDVRDSHCQAPRPPALPPPGAHQHVGGGSSCEAPALPAPGHPLRPAPTVHSFVAVPVHKPSLSQPLETGTAE